jgi:hypothetical protein
MTEVSNSGVIAGYTSLCKTLTAKSLKWAISCSYITRVRGKHLSWTLLPQKERILNVTVVGLPNRIKTKLFFINYHRVANEKRRPTHLFHISREKIVTAKQASDAFIVRSPGALHIISAQSTTAMKTENRWHGKGIELRNFEGYVISC